MTILHVTQNDNATSNLTKTQNILTPTSVLTLCSASCAFRAAFLVKNVTKQHPIKKTNITPYEYECRYMKYKFTKQINQIYVSFL